MRRVAMTALMVLAFAGVGHAQCLDGDYQVVGDPLLSSPGGAFTRDVITIDGDTLAIASGCPAVRARFRSTSRGTVIRANWSACGTLAQRARLRVVVNKTCRVMRGRFITRRPFQVRRVVAHHVVECDPNDATCRACEQSSDCTDAEYCAKTPGSCHATGLCAARPTVCTREYAPVCGCDRVTYANKCVAAANGANAAHEGRCRDVCGTIAGIPCPDDQFCDLEPGHCGAQDLGGRCVEIPHACPLVYDPVCGCDGVTYPSDCERQNAKASKAHDGRCVRSAKCESACDCYRTETFPAPCLLECATCRNYWTCDDGQCVPHCGPVLEPPMCEPRVCGGIAGLPCNDGEFCELPKGECHAADLQGICLPQPKICPDLYAPVCGCDGVTYSNECDRQAAGAQYAHAGPCGETCGTACDCEKTTPLPAWCAALECPACGCGWTCEAGRCAVQVKSPIPPSACE